MPPPDWEKVTEAHIVEKGTGSKELFGNVNESEQKITSRKFWQADTKGKPSCLRKITA